MLPDTRVLRHFIFAIFYMNNKKISDCFLYIKSKGILILITCEINLEYILDIIKQLDVSCTTFKFQLGSPPFDWLRVQPPRKPRKLTR